MSKFIEGQLVLVEMSSPRHYSGDDWKADIVGGEGSCRFKEHHAVSGSGSENFGDSGRVYATAKLGRWDGTKGSASFIGGGEVSCHVTEKSLFNVGEDPMQSGLEKCSLDKSIVVASPSVIKHLESLGFENVQDLDYNALALWIEDEMFVKLNSAHYGETSNVNYLTPDQVKSVKLPPVTVTIEVEISQEDLDEIIEDDELTNSAEEAVVQAIQDSQS